MKILLKQVLKNKNFNVSHACLNFDSILAFLKQALTRLLKITVIQRIFKLMNFGTLCCFIILESIRAMYKAFEIRILPFF